jgi:hypothetical protein
MRVRRLGWALACFVAACGGSGGIPSIEDGTDAGADATTQADSTTGDDASGDAGGADAPTPTDGGPDSGGGDAAADARSDGAIDAGADASDGAARDTGVVSDPGVVECGTAKCDTTTQLCCVTGIVILDSGTRARNCVDAGALACVGGAAQRCDEAADCRNNEICCARITLDGLETACVGQNGCTLGVQMCATDKECGQGVICYPHTCGPRTIGFCGLADAGARCP